MSSKCNGPQIPDAGKYDHGKTEIEKEKYWIDWKRHQNSFEYEEECENCNKKHYLETQADEHPEYYTDVYLKCECGEYVKFTLPVN